MKRKLPVSLLSTFTSIGLLSFADVSLGQQPKPVADQPVPRVQPEDPYKKAPSAQTVAQEEGSAVPAQVSLHFELFSLSLTEAAALMREPMSDGDRLKRVLGLIADGKARQERLAIIRTKSGQRAVTESISEFRYPTEWTDSNAPDESEKKTDKGAIQVNKISLKDPAPGGTIYASAFETRNTGETVEVEPVIGPDGKTIDLNVVPQWVHYIGDRVWDRGHPQEQPLFETQKITTSLSMEAGKPLFLGTCNTPFGTGLSKDDVAHQICLEFVTAYLITPEGEIFVAKDSSKTAANPGASAQKDVPRKP